LAAAYRWNGTFQTTKINVSLRPQRKTVNRETSEEMVGDRNRPLGLLLDRNWPVVKSLTSYLIHFCLRRSLINENPEEAPMEDVSKLISV
jgi:hypothetical protein